MTDFQSSVVMFSMPLIVAGIWRAVFILVSIESNIRAQKEAKK